MDNKEKTLKMLEIWRKWEPTINDIGLDSAVLSAMDEYAESQIKILNKHIAGNKEAVVCNPPNVLHCKLEIKPNYDCNKCKWKVK